jgi:peptidoglycan/xylan/chitin deacetylase (PgdA/CDA1 family)
LRSRLSLLALFLTGVLTQGAAAEPGRDCDADALGTSRTLTVGTRGGLEIGLKTYPRTLALHDHEVALTFDDGPATKTTPAVLDALKHECVKATFFLIGKHAQALPALVKREIAEGHTVGHHTFSHPAITLRRMSTAAAEADIDQGLKADDLAAYGTFGPTPRVPFFRFPGFADTPEVDRWLASRNIAVFGADLWASDWQLMTPATELALVMERLATTKGGIILFHDTKYATARMMPAFLRALKANGYHIVHLVAGDRTTETRPAPAGWSSETDRIINEVFQAEDTKAHKPTVSDLYPVRHVIDASEAGSPKRETPP